MLQFFTFLIPKEEDVVVSKPNLFILGTPRSATTFLYRALAQHPQIFMSAVKEPSFFSYDEREPKWITPQNTRPNNLTWEDYQNLFAGTDEYPIRGEASTAYLADGYAASRIKTRIGGSPHLVAVLRNPINRAYSHYLYHRMLNVEPCASFEEAIADEPNRQRKGWNIQWRYLETGYYGKHLQNYIEIFGRERLLILLHEDIETPDQLFQGVFRFLGVDEKWQVKNLDHVNQSGVSKNLFASWILKNRNPLRELGRRLLPRSARKGFRRLLTQEPPQLSQNTRDQLNERYGDDIAVTERLIGRSLESWRR